MSNTLTHCGALVKQHDLDRFFLSLFAPVDRREALWTLFAFNHEIAKTREVVSETQLGLIRLQWWRDEIGKIYDTGQAPENEILQALSKAIQTHALPQDTFETLIYGREFDLEGVLPSTIDGTLAYIEATNVPLMALMAQVLGVEESRAVAMNYGLIGLIRAIPFHAQQDRCYLPENELRIHDINEYTLYKGKNIEVIIPIVKDLTARMTDIKTAPKPFKAMNTWAKIYTNHLRKHGYDIYKMTNAPPPKFKELRTALGSLF